MKWPLTHFQKYWGKEWKRMRQYRERVCAEVRRPTIEFRIILKNRRHTAQVT